MRVLRLPVLGAALAAASVLSGAALAVGPWPGLAQSVVDPSADVSYTATRVGDQTRVRAFGAGGVVASATVNGAWGIPAVTSIGLPGGLSADGRLLVLAEPTTYQGLRKRSRFLVLDTKTLAETARVVLRGEFGFDAVSPDRRTLYVIQHRSSSDLVRYAVRAYDLRAGRLLPGAIVDKRDPDEAMRGYPVSRATTPRGTWVYTLYNRATAAGHPFVHALNAAGRYAFCIDLPAWPNGPNIWEARLELAGGRLVVHAPGGTVVARIDTKTLRVR